MAFTYILRTANGSYYVGSTDDLHKRLRQHHAGQVRSTKTKLLIELVYAEYFQTRGEAQQKEYRIKKWKSKKLVRSLVVKSKQSYGPIV